MQHFEDMVFIVGQINVHWYKTNISKQNKLKKMDSGYDAYKHLLQFQKQKQRNWKDFKRIYFIFKYIYLL